MDALIVGGFERSGHDALVAALTDAGLSRGYRIDVWNWRNEIPRLDEHPVFHVHRRAVARGVPYLAGILDSDEIGTALALDLSPLLPRLLTYDAILSAHPWSTPVVASALSREEARDAIFVDCHGEFAPFPVAIHPRVDIYTGGRIPRPLPWRIRKRCVSTGVPVRRQFDADGILKRSKLVIMAGSSGHSIAQIGSSLKGLLSVIQPDEVIALSGDKGTERLWLDIARKSEIAVRPISGNDDVSGILADATWLLTKASGPPVAEGIASRCRVICPPSGVFWEDEARAYLSADRVIVPIGLTGPPSEISVDDCALEQVAGECLSAADSIWSAIEHGPESSGSPDEAREVAALRSDVSSCAGFDGLSATSSVLLGICDSWDEGPRSGRD